MTIGNPSSAHPVVLTAGPRTITIESNPLIMGVLNVTPDSFSDGGTYVTIEQAVNHARQMQAQGADIIDIGAESSRPGAQPIAESEELRRLIPVVEAVREAVSLPISVDTTKAVVARMAIQAGAVIVNDISALQGDPLMAGLVAETGVAVVLMHMQGTPQTMQQSPQYDDVVDDICRFFEERIRYATKMGIREDAIWLDPGFGFGKTSTHNLEILRRLAEFKKFGRPILIGTSNKFTIGAVLNLPVEERMEGTAATVAVAIANGADAVRVHDVKRMVRVARMADAIVRGTFDE